jgi:hypothetical protein
LPPLERAAQCSVPIHVLVGAKSPVGIRKVGQALAETIPNASYDQLAGKGHMIDGADLLPFFKSYLSKLDSTSVATP